MPVIAPWLRPADVIGSASAGANIGLAARARDLQEAAQQQAADEFIARLNQQAQQFDRNLVSEQDIARQRLAAALREQDAMGVYRAEQAKLAREAIQSRENIAAERAAALLQRSIEPEFRNVPGGKAFRRGPESWQFIPEPTADKETVRTPAQWSAYIRDLNKQLESAGSDAEKATIGLQLKTAHEKQKELMTPGLPTAVITPGSTNSSSWRHPFTPPTITPPITNWVQQLTETNAPAMGVTNSPVVEEKVIVVKDGKRYRLPGNELEEAEKSGYRLER